jgi:hypothetical protein
VVTISAFHFLIGRETCSYSMWFRRSVASRPCAELLLAQQFHYDPFPCYVIAHTRTLLYNWWRCPLPINKGLLHGRTTAYVNDGLEVLTEVVINSTIFWDIMPFCPLKVNRRLGRIFCLHLQTRRKRRTRNQREKRWQAELLLSRRFLVRIFFQAWRWRRKVSPKFQLTFTEDYTLRSINAS